MTMLLHYYHCHYLCRLFIQKLIRPGPTQPIYHSFRPLMFYNCNYTQIKSWKDANCLKLLIVIIMLSSVFRLRVDYDYVFQNDDSIFKSNVFRLTLLQKICTKKLLTFLFVKVCLTNILNIYLRDFFSLKNNP